MVDGEGGSSEGCLKWGGGVIKGSFEKHLKIGGGQRQKLFAGEGDLKVSPPLPQKILIIHNICTRFIKCSFFSG